MCSKTGMLARFLYVHALADIKARRGWYGCVSRNGDVLTHRFIDKCCYERYHGIQLVGVDSFQHLPSFVVFTEPFRSAELSPFEKSTFTVFISLFLRTAVRWIPRAVNRDLLKSAAAEVEKFYMRKYSCNISKIPRLEMCKNLKVNREYISVPPTLVRKPSCLRKEDHGIRGKLSSACPEPF